VVKLVRMAEPSTKMRESKESCIEKSSYLKWNCKLNNRNCFETSSMTYFPKLEMLIFYGILTKPNCVNYVNKD